MTHRTSLIWRASMIWMALGVCLSVASLTWFGYRAVRGWQRSSMMLVARRADETADLLVSAFTRDMHATQQSILTSASWDKSMLDAPYDIKNVVAGAFARYPYPESFFGWRPQTDTMKFFFFNRFDRPPEWMALPASHTPFPVVVCTRPDVASQLIERLLQDAALGRRFSIFEIRLKSVVYQVVARLLYRDAFREQLDGVFGFTVNLQWVTKNYFPELTDQVAHIGTTGSGLALTVSDEEGRLVASTKPASVVDERYRRTFSLAFYEPWLVSLDRPSDLPNHQWIVRVGVAGDPTLASAIGSADRIVIISAISAAALAIGLLLTGRAARAAAVLAEMRSEFVSTVTHELKTPIATIRAAGDSLASGRIGDSTRTREYGVLVVQEAKRLGRLINNLLEYAKLTDVADIYSFVPVSLAAVVTQAIAQFEVQLNNFDLVVDIPPELPSVRADPTALELLFDNLVDNAIRYSSETGWIGLTASQVDDFIAVAVADRGTGIPEDELDRVTSKFVRGRHAKSSGSGLGLAIVDRIARDHGGSVVITSTLNVGTTVTVMLPIHEDEA